MYLIEIFIKMQKLFYPLSILFMLVLSLVVMNTGCNKDDSSNNTSGNTQEANEIIIQGMTFSPGNKTISVGTTIKWTNKESVTHTVTSGVPGSPSGLYDSGNLGANAVFSFTFTQVGTFKYYCKIHTSMTGTITVQ